MSIDVEQATLPTVTARILELTLALPRTSDQYYAACMDLHGPYAATLMVQWHVA